VDFLLKELFIFFQSTADVVYYLAFGVAVALLISGLDEFIIDLYYWILYLFRPKKLNPHRYEIPENLDAVEQKPIAVFIPAWLEYEVIDKMLLRACQTIEYKNYDIFVGTYPNDPQTLEKVRSVAAQYPQVHAVIGSRPGPSTKAENLNTMHQGMIQWENRTGIRYDIIVLHDSEDVIHPLSLKLHNYYIKDYDMVQLPVYPLEVSHRSFIHWTYADEFAENHTKDLLVRQHLTGFVPSAGVGTAYNRWLIEFAGTSFARNIFRKASLTEDYDMALRLALGRARLSFLYMPMKLEVGTRAYFPMTFSSAVRQKTRWLIGICLQSWKNIGWVGDLGFRFALYHDRKAVVTNIINVLAYFVLFYILLYELVEWGLSGYGTLRPIITPGTVLYAIVVADTVLMFWRLLNRFITVRRIYGWFAGFLSIVRLPIGNFINFAASIMGIVQYLSSRVQKKALTWDKTHHVHFPELKVREKGVA